MTARPDTRLTAFVARRHGGAYVALALWCALVWYLSSKSDPGDTVGFFMNVPDYILHGAEFAAGGLLAARALSHLRHPLNWLAALAFCVVFGFLDEWHQSYVPGRCADFMDVVADSVGASIGILLHALVARTARV